jgi:hypothetical protein
MYDVPMKKKNSKKPFKGRRISSGVLRFFAFRLKDPCYGPLTKESQERAAKAHSVGGLDLQHGQLRCECGKAVGAKRAIEGNHFEPDPRPHELYKEPRRPALKHDFGKRM